MKLAICSQPELKGSDMSSSTTKSEGGGTTGHIARVLNLSTRTAGMALLRLAREGWVDSVAVREPNDPRGRRWQTRLWRVRK